MFFVSDVASELGLTVGRINQICRKFSIGELIRPNLRVLSARDVDQIQKIIASYHPGREQKKSENRA